MKRMVAAWVLAVALIGGLALVVVPNLTIKTDLSFFLPRDGTPETAALSASMRNRDGGALTLIALSGADATSLAQASREVTESLRATGLFHLVANGTPHLPAAMIEQARAWRYLTGPDLSPDAFTSDSLRRSLSALLSGLSTAEGWALRQTLSWNPDRRMDALRDAGASAAQPPTVGGVWITDGAPPSALIVAQTKAAADDQDGQGAVKAALDRTAATLASKGVTLTASGPGLFAVDTRLRIEGEMRGLSILATVLVLIVLGAALRRPLPMLAAGLPLTAAVLTGAGAVQAFFGGIHGVALTFGATLIGVAVDYPLHLFGHQSNAEPATATARRLSRPLFLSAATTIAGFCALIPSGFGGLAQLGVFAVTGLTVAVLVSRWLLPHLSPVPAPSRAAVWTTLLEHDGLARLLKGGLPVVAGIAAAIAALSPGPFWEDSLSALSPISAESKALDRDLRQATGMPDVRHLLLVQGADAEAVLRAQEPLRPRLEGLVRQGAIGGFVMAADLLPSLETQTARQKRLPPRAVLERNLDLASDGLPFKPGTFTPFLDDVATQQALPAITVAAYRASPLGWRLAPLLQDVGDGAWQGYVLLSALSPGADLTPLEAADGSVRAVDLKRTADDLVTAYRFEALRWLGLGLLAGLVILTAGLRSLRQGLKAALPAGSAIAATVALLSAGGVALSLFHVLALLLVAGIGVDYALFFNIVQASPEARRQSFRAIVLCNATTLSVFAVLAVSSVPVLSSIGLTAALGSGLSLLFTYAFGQRRGES